MKNENDKIIRIMEVCGTHTMSIARFGIKSMLPENIKLISGPGCPVCVTLPGEIDALLRLSQKENVIIAAYGDMLKIPGSRKGDNLNSKRAAGADVEIIYSPTDALEIAKKEKDKEIIFTGAGFETTSPGTAAVIENAHKEGISNFSVFCMLRRIKPALCKLVEMPDFNVDGFLCPGHVAVITGAKCFDFLCEQYHIPAVIGGFEADEIMRATAMILKQINAGDAFLENAYEDVVSYGGNEKALKLMEKMFDICDNDWRGLGHISDGGYKIKDEYKEFDAAYKFNVSIKEESADDSCRCGDVICGRIEPKQCPQFATACTPEDPSGPCMVSSEGSCAAAYNYEA